MVDGVSVFWENSVTPTVFKLLSVNYYDNYTLPSMPAIPSTVEGQNVFYTTTVRPVGMATGSWVRVTTLSTATAGERSYILYNRKALPIRVHTTNYLGGYTQVDENKNAFTGQVAYSVTRHKRLTTDAEIYTKNSFTYSDQNRLLTHIHQIGTAGVPQLLASNNYNEFGQLISKQVGGTDVVNYVGLQKVDYSYNIRGWLTGINDVMNLTQGSDPRDLFAYRIRYTAVENSLSGTVKPLYNGNIAEVSWRTTTDDVRRSYGFSFDHLNRMTKAVYQKPNASEPVTYSYNESLRYDKNGNIITLRRNGDLDSATDVIEIDNLSYTYDMNKPNQLMKVFDSSRHPAGFDDDSVDGLTDPVNDYSYDNQGNMTSDQNKGITSITYNHLNQPLKIIFNNNTNTRIEYFYTSSGEKVQKKVFTAASAVTTTDYLDGFQYTQTNTGMVVLQFFPHAEGYVNNTVVSGANVYSYVFNYTDHLGNIRLRFTRNTNGTLRTLEQNHYYPYGMKHEKYNEDEFVFIPDPNGGYNSGVTTGRATGRQEYQYKLNNREWQDELGLNMTAMDYRQYDNALGRFNSIDALTTFIPAISPYSFGFNNPVFFADPTGLLGEGNTWLDAIWNNSPNNASTTWVNDGFGNFDNADGSGFVNSSTGEYHQYSEVLPEVTIYKGHGNTRNGDIIRGHVYWNSKYYQHWRDGERTKQWDDLQSGLDWFGTADPTGLVDLVNAGIYAARGQTANAAISAIAILPFGDLAKGTKLANKTHTIYHALDASGTVKYVGITSRDLAKREAEHKTKDAFKELIFREVGTTTNRLDARIMEQNMINQYGLPQNGGSLLNSINSIAPSKWKANGIK
jgi:RHS repeat-associated protein